MADPKHPRKSGEGSRRQIVQPCDNGKPLCEIMPGHGLGRSTVSRWAKRIHDSGSTRAADNRTPERDGTVGPGRENKQPRMEAGASRTAAPMFARRRPRYRRAPAGIRHRRSARRWACLGRPTTG